MTSLLEKYRPSGIPDFLGLEKPRQTLRRFADMPYPCACLFTGPPGIV